jgi:purine-binding chemotaxis protein CheW
MEDPVQLVVFTLDQHRYGLKLPVVERVVRSVQILPLPSAPDIVLGVMNLAGQVVPVVNIRMRFRLPEKEVDLDDQIIIAKTARRTVGLIVDSTSTLAEVSATEVTQASKILPRLEYIEGVEKLKDGMILIHDLDKFLSLDEEQKLDAAIAHS